MRACLGLWACLGGMGGVFVCVRECVLSDSLCGREGGGGGLSARRLKTTC